MFRFAVAAILLGMPTAALPKGAPPEATLSRGEVITKLAPSPAHFSILLPPGYAAGGHPYSLVLLLHGGGGSDEDLARLEPLIEMAWANGDLPPAVVVMPDADRSLYIDYRDGSQKWDTFIVSELVPYLRAHYNLSKERSQSVVIGASMGGEGALTLGFRHPEVFGAIAALEPGIAPSLSYHDLKVRNRFWRTDAFFEERFGKPVDENWYKEFNPANLAICNRAQILSSSLAIYLDVGANDMFNLDEGAEFLHRVLWDQGIPHEYHLVLGADHLGRTLAPRFLEAFRFLKEHSLAPPGPDMTPRLVDALRRVTRWKAEAGVDVKARRPPFPSLDATLDGSGICPATDPIRQ
ncbi:MAG: alpha/beta hydrolase [Caulobacteraceae bacterium]